MTLKRFGKRLRELREARGWSQRQLAERCGVPLRSEMNWEQGRSLPKLENVIDLAWGLGMTLDDLLELPTPSKRSEG
jgi:transcriptional regulator with XRE-family HTH domain